MPKKICFVGGGLKGGGQERALTSLANYYASKGYEITIINLFKTEQFFDLENNITVIWPDIDRNKFPRFLYALHIMFFLRKSIRNSKTDVILSFGEWFNSFVILSTRLSGIPLYVTDRMGPELKISLLLEITRKILYRFATGIIAQTHTAAEIIRKKTQATNIVVIPNPVNCIDTDTSIKKKQIVTVVRLSKEKGNIILVEAFAMLKQPDWTLHIVGDGKERFSLENKVAELGIENKVFFYGHLKNFSQILGKSEIFVLPSFYEGFPNALLEAMSIPLACVSSNCIAGPSDIIENYINGILVKTADVNMLADALQRLITDDNLRQKIASKAYEVREKYKFDVIAKRYLDFILCNSKIDVNNK